MAGSHDSSPTRHYGPPSVNTSYVAIPDREQFCEQVQFGATSGTFNVVAPCSGSLIRAEVQSQTTTDGTNTITLAVTNESNSSASMATAVFDADPVLTSNTVGTCTLSSTEANLAVSQGDNIEVAYTEGGTIAGGVVSLYFAAHA